MSLKKLAWSSSAVAIAALAAVTLLLSAGPSTADAAVNGVSASRTTLDAAANAGATECFTGAFAAGAGVAGTNCSVLTIDADTGNLPLQIVTTSGAIAVPPLTGCTGGACTVTTNGTANVSVTVGDVNTVTAIYAAPTTGPATATVTVLFGTSSRSVTLTIRGTADALEFKAFNALATAGSTCTGTAANVIRSSTATIGLVNAFFCVLVRDSAGTRLANQPVIFTTTSGTLSAAADPVGTGATGQSAVGVTLAAGTSGTSGTKATVTASSGGRSAALDVLFGGDPASCVLSTDPGTVQTGGSAQVIVDVKDAASTPGPVPDGIAVAVAQTNPGAGVNAAILNPAPTTVNGRAQTTLIAAIPGAIALGATAPAAGPPTPVNCTGSVIATGTVAPPGGTPPPAGVAFSGTTPARGSIGLLVVRGTQTSATLVAAFGAAGCPVESLAILVAGRWLIFINGAPVVVNAAFPAQLIDLTPFFVRCSA